MIFSIIICTVADDDLLKRSFDSALSQASFLDNFEIVIVPAIVFDSSHYLYKSSANVKVTSASKNGIYNAFNAGVENSSGEYIYFLNSGDVFVSASVLRTAYNFIRQLESPEIIFGRVLLGRSHFLKLTRPMFRHVHLGLPHQGVFARKEIYSNFKFNERFTIAGDNDLWERLRTKSIVTPVYCDFLVANFLIGGASTSRKALERRLEEHKQVRAEVVPDRLKRTIGNFMPVSLRYVAGELYRLALRKTGWGNKKAVSLKINYDQAQN